MTVKADEQTLIKRFLRPAAIFCLFSLLFAVCQLLGGQLEMDGYLGSLTQAQKKQFLVDFVSAAVLSTAGYAIWRMVSGGGRAGREADHGEKALAPGLFRAGARRESAVGAAGIWAVLFGVNVIELLGVYPGFFVYDAYEELKMVQSGVYTAHHPLLHVLLLGKTISFFRELTGSWNTGIFIWCLLQAAVIDAVFAWTIRRQENLAGRAGILARTAFYLLCPTVSMFVLCSCKDGLFSASMLVWIMHAKTLCRQPERFYRSPGSIAGYLGAALLMMLLRHNGVYAFAAAMLLMLAANAGGNRKKLLLMALVTAALYFGISRMLVQATDASTGERQEMLTVPIQQIARAYTSDPESFSPEDRAYLRTLMSDKEWMRYTPALSDPVKVCFRNEVYDADPGQFFSVWLRTLRAHPMTCINAWLMTSYGYWYKDAIVDCYQGGGVFTFTYGESSYFGYETEPPGERASMIPAIDTMYRRLSLEAWPQRVPVLHMLYSPGGIFWIWLYIAACMAASGRVRSLLPFTIVLMVWLTVLLGPCTLPRYVLYLWFALPALPGLKNQQEALQ